MIWSNESYPCETCRHAKVKYTKEPCKGCLASEVHPEEGENKAKGWEHE